MMDATFLEILACPACGHPVVEKTQAMECVDCHRVYPIVEGIPAMLIGESRQGLEKEGTYAKNLSDPRA